jgi:pimeloyl-ACP methyl ester carboxylesterase
MRKPSATNGYRPTLVGAQDGLKLFVRDYGERRWTSTPVVCLPGLSRSSADYHELALYLSCGASIPRRVICCDMRGRGRSQYDKRPANYEVLVETRDVLSVTAAMGIGKAIFVGASRGGLQMMVLAAMRPSALASAVLVDIGPVIDGKGLARIKGYVGKLPAVRDFEEAATMLKRLGAAQFPAWSDAQWALMARHSYRETATGLVPDYDPALARTLEAVDLEAPLPAIWPLFEAMAPIPLLVIRGQNSDILSQATLAEMARRHPRCQTLTVPGEGHVPDIGQPKLTERIASFADGLEPDPEKLADFSDKIMRQNKDFDVARDST